jgi:hypothetical protein
MWILFLILQVSGTPVLETKITTDLWELAPTETANRWLIIHNLAEAEKEGLYHVEVVERGKGDPTWKIKRLAAHLAITKGALLRSVRRPLRKGHVYPEHFDHAYEAWRKLEASGTAPICKTDVLKCLTAATP